MICKSKNMRSPEATRVRIIEAAGRLFATHGFNGVGFREIARKAHVSLRMPNHHFGTKRRLFAECIRHALGKGLDFPEIFRITNEITNSNTANRELGRKIQFCFLATHTGDKRRGWYGRILARALTENLPEGLDALEKGLKPARDWFFTVLKSIRPKMKSMDILLWYVSLWAQVSFYHTARHSILHRAGKRKYDKQFLNAAANHLVRTMLAQLR